MLKLKINTVLITEKNWVVYNLFGAVRRNWQHTRNLTRLRDNVNERCTKPTQSCIVGLEAMIRMEHDMHQISNTLCINGATTNWSGVFQLDSAWTTCTGIESWTTAKRIFSTSIPMTNLFDMESYGMSEQILRNANDWWRRVLLSWYYNSALLGTWCYGCSLDPTGAQPFTFTIWTVCMDKTLHI